MKFIKKILLGLTIALSLASSIKAQESIWYDFPVATNINDTSKFLILQNGEKNIAYSSLIDGLFEKDSNNTIIGVNLFTGDSKFHNGRLFLPLADPDTAGAIGLNQKYLIFRTTMYGKDSVATFRYIRDSLGIDRASGIALLAADQTFTGVNTLTDTIKVNSRMTFGTNGQFFLPTLEPAIGETGAMWGTMTALGDSLTVYVSNDDNTVDTVAMNGWVRNFFSKTQATIGDLTGGTTTKLGLKKWDILTGWQKSIDDNMQLIDTTTYWLDPLAFYVSNDTLYIDTSFVSAGAGSMLKSTYDPATIGEQLVGLTANQLLTNKTINGVVLNSTGSASTYLDATGSYSVPSGTGTGEANLGSNIGSTGLGIYTSNSGVYLQFKNLNAGTGLSISSNSTDITYSLNGSLALLDAANIFTQSQTMPYLTINDGLSIKNYLGNNIVNFDSSGFTYFKGPVDSYNGYEIGASSFIDGNKDMNVGNINAGNINVGNITSGDISAGDITGADAAFTTITVDEFITNQISLSIIGISTIDASNVSLIDISAPTPTGATITNIIGGVTGQRLTIYYSSSSNFAIMQDNINVALSGNFTMRSGDTIELLRISTKWVELSRSDN